jgi:hypothetical protein
MIKTLTGVKAICAFFLFSFLFNYSSHAQIKIGVKGGLNLSNIRGGNTSPNNTYRTGGHLGFYGHYTFKDKMGIQGELLFSQKGTITRSDDPRDPADFYVRINYLDLPVLFTYEFVEGLTGQIGLEMSAPVGAYTKREGHPTDYFIQHLNKPIFSLPIGINYELQNGLNFGARADLGLSAIGGDGGKNYVFMFSVGYSFYKNGSSGSSPSKGKK